MLFLKELVAENNSLVEYIFNNSKNARSEEVQTAFKKYCEIQKQLQTWSNLPAKLIVCGKNGEHKPLLRELISDHCQLCGLKIPEILELHHVIPKSLGGSDNITNLVVLCPTCHDVVHLPDKDDSLTGKTLVYFSKFKSDLDIRILLYYTGHYTR